MDMQAFYKLLSVKPTQQHQHRLSNLTRVSRSQVLDATSEQTWLVWGAETANS